MTPLLRLSPRTLFDKAKSALIDCLRRFPRGFVSGFLGRFDPRARDPGKAPWSNDPHLNRQVLNIMWREHETLCRALRIMRLAWLVTLLLAIVGWAT